MQILIKIGKEANSEIENKLPSPVARLLFEKAFRAKNCKSDLLRCVAVRYTAFNLRTIRHTAHKIK